MDIIRDFFGKKLEEGDIVIRPKFKSFSLHRIKKFTKKRIELTVRRDLVTPAHYRPYKELRDSTKVKDVFDHNESMYIKKDMADKSLIKWVG